MSTPPASADVVIIGGAAIGSSVACHLALDPAFTGRVVVVEKDMTYAKAASALSAASIRQQFSSPVNIAISLYGIGFLRDIAAHLAVDGEAPDLGLVEHGYLYIATQTDVLRETQAVQAAAGADILYCDQADLAARFPWLNVADLACGTWGRSGEGWFDGWGLMQAFRRKARSLGVTYVEDRVTGLEQGGGRVTAVTLASGGRIACGTVVNAAGASGGPGVAAMAGVALPVQASKRCVFTFTCKAEIPRAPLLIDISGTWCRPEGHRGVDGQLYLCGGEPGEPTANEAEDFEVDWPLFEEVYWPALAHRVPAFEAIRPGRAWAGHYDMNLLDHNAVLGPVPGLPNLYLANGFSGHGLQQSPAVGRGLAEHILHGAYRSIDLSPLGYERILEDRPILERNVI